MTKRYSHKISKLEINKEVLSGSGITLVSILLPLGSNVYILSYPKNGGIYHTMIDTGFIFNSDLIIRILESNGISPANIENILLTHHHGDHCGLAKILEEKSGAQILIPKTFQTLIENGYKNNMDKMQAKYFDPTSLGNTNLTYLEPKGKVALGGLNFPFLGEIPLANSDKLTIIACPPSNNMHTDNQVIILYSQYNTLDTSPSDIEILFSGDLWLMESPDFKSNLKLHFQFLFRRFLNNTLKRDGSRFAAREQDKEAKEALKRAFAFVRVKPGHGKEFLGARMLPNSIFCVEELQEECRLQNIDENIIFDNAYQYFCNELLHLQQIGFPDEKMLAFLYRLYIEQSGGSRSISRDRAERRVYLKRILERLRTDESKLKAFRNLASMVLSSTKQIDGDS